MRLALMCTVLAGCGLSSSSDSGVVDAGEVSSRATEVCRRWKADRAELSEGTWSGAVSSCDPGDLSSDGRANALKLVNLYRFLAQLPEVTTTASLDAEAQACALMMDANNSLDHTPPTSWKCFTTLGSKGAGRSNICSTGAVRCIDLYMSDEGNEDTLGHRRWLLSNTLGPIGIGGSSGGSCHVVLGGTGSAAAQFVAYPPPGPVPLEAIHLPKLDSVDRTGWSVQFPATAVTPVGGHVQVFDNGVEVPVSARVLSANFGSATAIAFVPVGWVTTAGHVYSVVVRAAGGEVLVSYDVRPMACD